MNEIIENLWLGGVSATKNLDTLSMLQITHVLSVGVRPQVDFPYGTTTKFFEAEDTEE